MGHPRPERLVACQVGAVEVLRVCQVEPVEGAGRLDVGEAGES